MSTLATAIRDEVRRLARKEVKAQTSKTREQVAHYRHEIASLKRQLRETEQKVARLESAQANPEGGASATAGSDSLEPQLRFSPKSVKSQRGRLGLSAADYAKLVGVSALTIYNWEHGTSRPRRAQLEALAAVRGIGKREATRRLAELDGTGEADAGSESEEPVAEDA